MSVTSVRPLHLYCSYAPEDASCFRELRVHLGGLLQARIIEVCDPGLGTTRQEALARVLCQTDIILVLISPDYLASPHHSAIELPMILDCLQGGTRIVPILVRPVYHGPEAPWARLVLLPTNQQPVSLWSNRDLAWTDVVMAISSVVLHPEGGPYPTPRAPYQPDWYVPRRRIEQDLLHHLLFEHLAVLYGPVLIGKTMVLSRIMQVLRERDGSPRVVSVNLRSLAGPQLTSSEAFFLWLAEAVIQGAGVDRAELDAFTAGQGDPGGKLRQLLQRLLSGLRPEESMALVIDHADILCLGPSAPRDLPDTFFGCLRSWAELSRDQSGPWSRLRLLLSVTTTPGYLVQNLHQSPFAGSWAAGGRRADGHLHRRDRHRPPAGVSSGRLLCAHPQRA